MGREHTRMNITLLTLHVMCRRPIDPIVFRAFNYFYGEVGSGKSTIARLIDYCLGGDLVLTPALQSQFVAAALELNIAGTPVRLEREVRSAQLLATWEAAGHEYQVAVPARQPSGPILPGTEVENLSDLIFHIAGISPPRVRRSQAREDSDLGRLSLRDLLWYCYLDQDEIDSTFFHLDRAGDTFKRLKSRSVMRYILGIHQEQVAELETKLEAVRQERAQLLTAADTLETTLRDAQIGTAEAVTTREGAITAEIQAISDRISAARQGLQQQPNHAGDVLRSRGRDLAEELAAIESTLTQVQNVLAADERHLNEMKVLTTKVRRLRDARAVLRGVEFAQCPRCMQHVPSRAEGTCSVCGQVEPSSSHAEAEIEQTRADLRARIDELQEAITSQRGQLGALQRRRSELRDRKAVTDRELSDIMRAYDSSFLSTAIADERQRANLEQELHYIRKMSELCRRVAEMRQRSDGLAAREAELRRNLAAARDSAQRDLGNLNRLKELFLDCLLRARIPGFSANDEVRLDASHFLPIVLSPETGETATTSFETLGSGGKKTLFKCCFALAIHRLAVEIDATLPSFLIIDSPMKNISERENRAQFEGFHQMLYQLAAGELRGTQIILIDKEFCPPSEGSDIGLLQRHMTVARDDAPPLITYWRQLPEADGQV